MGSLFQSQPSVSYQSPSLPPYLQNYLTSASNWLTSQVGVPAPAYTGPLSAGLSNAQLQAINALAAGEPGVSGAGATGLTSEATTAAGGGAIPGVMAAGGIGLGELAGIAAGGNDPLSNPDILGTVTALSQMTGATIDEAMSAINAQASAMGLGNSTPLLNEYNQALAKILPQFAGTAGNLMVNATEQNWQNELAASQALSGLPLQAQGLETTAGSDLMSFWPQYLNSLMSAGTTAQGTEQNLLTSSYQDWLRQMGGEWQAAPTGVQSLAGLTAPQPVTYNPPPITGMLTGALAAFGPKLFGG